MILTDYYRFEKTALKSKTRMDCTASTQSYPELEEKRATKQTLATTRFDATEVGNLVVYIGDVPDRFGGNVHRKADKALTMKGKNVSSIYVPDIENGLAYGDFKGTEDALVFVLKDLNIIDGRIQAGSVFEMFVARGQSNNRVPLYDLLSDGELDEEMEALRKQSKNE